ncbi:peptidase m20 domain-containing protein 2 [Plakobranchus ocellatus]|uniref:Peptidase m20 domain-containing protein 2 n=1 Tax=Plakobranchus ocellatus TaxID=259542 RepID=A0AAV4AHS1_9GAST|nr:peptidase m20 domain-containing protein 2 [Plakobranchus ocellatus]
MPNSTCVTFQDSWLQDPCFSGWLKRSSSNSEAHCSICKKNFDFKSMGRSALVSHMKGKKHLSLVSASNKSDKTSLLNFVCKNKGSSQSQIPTSSSVVPSPSNSLDNFISDSTVLLSEIWWCLRTAMNNHFTSSNADIDFYLKQMFPDVPIIQKFSCGYTKSSYMMSFGIAPYLRNVLVEQMRDEPFSLMFDESLNKSLTQKQLDIHVRFWCGDVVESRYFDSKMLGHSTSDDLLEALNTCRESIDFRHLVHLSMDGPNVNWATFNKLQAQLKADYDNSLFNVGSCGIHQLHNALRKGMDATGWDLPHVLTSADFLFKDMPARREDFTSVTGSSVFPAKYCGHRWVENQMVMMKLKECLPNLKVYVKAVKDKKISDPCTKPFTVVKTFTDDPLAEMKLAFAIALCKPVERFLTKYQTDRPMIPFLYNDLNELLLSMTKRIANVESVNNITEFDLEKKEKLLELSKVNVGTEAAELLKRSKLCTPRMILDFRTSCQDAVVATVRRLLKKSPLSYSLCRDMQFLDPTRMIQKPETSVKYFKSALLLGIHCPLSEIDDLLDEYEQFVDNIKTREGFVNFNSLEDRVDQLLFNEMANNAKYVRLWDFIKKCLVVSHGQATVERGFSENKMALDHNMGEKTLIARRTIKDYVRSIGGIEKFKISEELLKSCSLSNRRYKAFLEEKKNHVIKSSKRKQAEEDVIGLKRRKVELTENAAFLRKESERKLDKAEKLRGMKEQLALFTSANALRKAASEKEEEIASISKKIGEKEAALKLL